MSRRVVALALAAALLSGCAATHNLFTNPTGKITIERQQFINTYSYLYVLTKGLLTEAEEACTEGRWPESNCARLPGVKQELIVFDLSVRAKIAIPESELDWDVILGILKGLAGLRP